MYQVILAVVVIVIIVKVVVIVIIVKVVIPVKVVIIIYRYVNSVLLVQHTFYSSITLKLIGSMRRTLCSKLFMMRA